MLWHERLGAAPRRAAAGDSLLALAASLSLADTDGAGLLEIPAGTQRSRAARGGRAAKRRRPGLRPREAARRTARRRPRRASDRAGPRRRRAGRARAAQCDPFAELPDARAVGAGAGARDARWSPTRARSARACRARRHGLPRPVVRREGGHGRPSRRAHAAPAARRRAARDRRAPQWLALASSRASSALTSACRPRAPPPSSCSMRCTFYAGLTLEEIGGKGVRWQERDAAGAYRIGQRRMTLSAPAPRRLLRRMVDPGAEGDRDLRRRAAARAGRAGRRAQAARSLPGALRPQPRGPLRRAAADGRHPQAADQGAVSPDDVRSACCSRSRRSSRSSPRSPRSRSSPSATCRTSSARRSGCTGSTSRSARSTCSRSARSPSTGSCSAAGRRGRSTRSSGRCAAPRS